MATYEIHAFEPKNDYNENGNSWYCPGCHNPLNPNWFINGIIPSPVAGEHSFEIQTYQCEVCEKIVVMVIDELQDA